MILSEIHYKIDNQDTQYDLENKKQRFVQLVEILNLFTDQPIQLVYVECKTPVFYPVETSSAVEVINPRGYSPYVSTLTSEDINSLLKFYEKISNLNNKAKPSFAIRRYNYVKQ